jgi:TolA-binding protein
MTRLAFHAVTVSFLTCSFSFAEDAPASAADLLKAGDEAFAKKEFSVAADKFSALLEKYAGHAQAPSVQLKLADALIAAGLPLRASTTFEALLREHADSKEAVKGRFLLGKTLEARGDFLRAIAQYKQYIVRHPKEANVRDLRLRIPAIYEDVLGKWPDATREWLAFVKQHPADPKAAESLDHAAWLTEYRLRRQKEAVELYARVVKEYPNFTGRQKAQGRLAYLCEDGGIRDYQRAVQEYRNYIKWYPKAEDLYEKTMRLAFTLRHRVNQQVNAVDAYKAALKIKPNPEVAYALAYSLYGAGDRKNAVVSWKEFIAKYPEDHRVHSAWQLMRDRLWELTEKEETLKVAAEVCQKYPKDVGDHWIYAHRLRDVKQYAKSNELFYKCEEILPGYQSGYLYELVAGNFLYLEDVAGAENAVKASFQKLPGNADVFVRGHWALGTSIYPKQKKTQEAAKALEALCVKFPDHAHWPNPDHSLPRIESYYRTLKSPTDAYEAFNRIYQAHPNSKNARFARVYAIRALTEAKQYDKAIAEAKAMRDENMDDDPWGWASVEYGVALGAKGDTLGQLETFAIMPVIHDRSGFGYSKRNIDHYRAHVVNKLLNEAKAKADDPQSQLIVGLCLYANGDLAGAAKSYAALLAKEDLAANLKAVAQRARGEVLALQNRVDDAEPVLDDLKEPQLIALGNSYDRQNRLSKALDVFEALRKKKLDDRYPQLRIAQIYDRNRQFEKSIEEYLNLLKKWPDEKDNQQIRRRINDLCFAEHFWDNQVKGRELSAQLYQSHPDPYLARSIYYSFRHRKTVDHKIALEWAKKYASHPDAEPGDAGIKLMDAYHTVGKYEESAQFGQQWVGKHRQHANALDMMYRTAEEFRHTPQRERALPIFRMLVSRWPESNQALEATLRCYDIPGPHRISMLEQWVRANPDHYRVAEFKYRIGLVHESEKREEEAIKAYRDVWDNHRTKWAENMYCSWNIAEIYRRQEKHAEARKIYEEVIEYFGANRHHQIRYSWARLLEYYIKDERPKAEIKEFCGRLLAALANTYEIIPPLTSLAQIFEEEGDYLESAIAMQKLILLTPKNHDATWNQIKALVDKKMEDGRYGEAAMLYRALARHNTGYKKERVQEVEQAMGTALGKSGAGFAAIDSKLEEAGLLWGNVFAQAGEEELAWQKYLASENLFKKYMHLIHPAFIKIVVGRMIFEKKIAHGIDFCRLFMVKHMDNKNMLSQSKGEVQILLGDCYFRDERFDIARDEYATVVNIFDGTDAAIDARFKIGQTLMAQKIYAKAEEIFETLATTSRKEQVIARANLMLGVLYHTMGEPKKAEEQFKTVLALNPRHDTADEIIYRLGIVYHQRGRYKEALDTLKLIGAYSGESKRQVAPGTELRIRLSDRNLNLTRGAADVPILVEVTDEDGSKGDIEKIFLTRSQAGAGLFVGGLYTALGEPKKNDNILQISGTSIVSYRYDPVFAQDFILSEDDRGMEQVIKVAADAILEASATEIKDEDETDEIDPDMFNKEKGRDGVRLFRDETQLKPGNPLYLRVRDGDRDRTNATDTIEVMVTSASGDAVPVKLEETGPHTGEFRGQVSTALRPADALASDSAEGRDARFAIDGSREASKAWVGRMDGRAPKWIAADLKEVFKANKLSFHRGEGFKEDEDRRILRYDLLASKNREEWDLIASHPMENALIGAKVVWDPDGQYANWGNKILEANGDRESRWRGKEGLTEWVIDIDLGKTHDIGRTNLRPHDKAYEVRRYSLYVEKEAGEYPGQKRDIDGWKSVYESEALNTPKDDIHLFEPGQAVGRYIRIVVKDKFHRYPEIGEFEISPRTKFELVETEDKAGATITFPTIETRFLKLVIREFKNDAPAIAELKVFGPEDKQLLPPDIDVHQLATNNILEISPGDTLTAAYADQKNIYPGEPNILRESLSATFFNGTIKAVRHYFHEDDNGNRHKEDFDVYRVEAGERFIVQITEYDADKTDDIDRVPFTARTSSGAILKLEATETGPYSGVFVKEVDTSADEQAGALFLKEGDSILLSYWDEENTFPGNRTERQARLFENVPTRGMVLISVEEIEYHRIPKYDPESIGQVKLLAPEMKLYLAVYDPDAATDGNSKIKVKLKTSPGNAEVEVECEFRYHYYRPNWEHEWRQMWGGPEHKLPGLFIGQIELALGDKDSPAFKIEAFQFEDSQTKSKKKKETTQVPVLNAMGSDTITVVYIDNAVPDNPLSEEREDLARLITDAEFGFYDSEYEEIIETAHLGEKLHLFISDADGDTSETRDELSVLLQTNKGDKLTVKLRETLSHSGQFTLPLALEPTDPNPDNDKLEAQFGTLITATYQDVKNTKVKDSILLKVEIPVVTGTDGTLMAFSRKYPDGEIAVETEFKIGECHYYLGRALIKNKEKKGGLRHLSEGQEILSELIVHHPDAEYLDEATYLLGNVAQERESYFNAIRTYRQVIMKWPESPVAADAQYKTAMCLEKLGRFDDSCEEYVRLAYQFPQSALVSDSMIRIGLYYFKRREYDKASSVFERFVSKYPDHNQVEKVGFKQGLCYILSGSFIQAGDHFKAFAEAHPSSDMKPAALYWSGDAYLKGNKAKEAYVQFKTVVWKFPEEKWAKYARGRLTAPVFDRISEDDSLR